MYNISEVEVLAYIAELDSKIASYEKSRSFSPNSIYGKQAHQLAEATRREVDALRTFHAKMRRAAKVGA